MKKWTIVIIIIGYLLPLPCPALENIFYILRGNLAAIKSLSQHYAAIDILLPQAYVIHADGQVSGSLDPIVLNFAKTHGIKVMALVTNSNFDQKAAHQFLQNKNAQIKALQTILMLTKQLYVDGVQIDFENISEKDKALLTQFYQTAYSMFHAQHLLMSVAVVPAVSGINNTLYQKRRFENWTGAYDLNAIAAATDFITLMSYDQHMQGTTPGAAANFPWVNATIQYALQFVPANKLSLGVPTYSNYWYTTDNGRRIFTRMDNVTFNLAQSILNKYHATTIWDNLNKIHFSIFDKHWLNAYLFIEDAQSFQEKTTLANLYHLRGISVFELGFEDPSIWQVNTLRRKTNIVLPKNKTVKSHPIDFHFLELLFY